MSKIIEFPKDADPEIRWPGHADVNKIGARLAIEMLEELEDSTEGGDGVCEADRGCLEDWPREGKPFRNVVLEYLHRARAEGADIEAGFCAVLTDYVGLDSADMSCSVDRYRHMLEIE